jgi:hypothetical protein
MEYDCSDYEVGCSEQRLISAPPFHTVSTYKCAFQICEIGVTFWHPCVLSCCTHPPTGIRRGAQIPGTRSPWQRLYSGA